MILCEYKTRAGARRLLDKMIQNAILRKIGSGPGAKYVLNEGKWDYLRRKKLNSHMTRKIKSL